MPGSTEGHDDRRFLFLQGPLCPLFAMMGAHLRDAGCEVHRVNFCPGDWLHWHGEGCSSYRGSIPDWPAHVGAEMDSLKITDLVLHGDQRIYHKAAIAEAKARGIDVYCSELGFLRPGWMTLEREGLSTLSHFPVDPARIKAVAAAAGPQDMSPLYPGSAWMEIVPDVIYNLSNVFLRPLYPHYERHTIYPPVIEYLKGGWRLLTKSRRDATVTKEIDALFASGKPYFVMPLQLQGDFQLRAHSPFKGFEEAVEEVMLSFARAAPSEAVLVLKSHPLDAGFEDWASVIGSLASRYRISDRVLFLDGGRLDRLFEKASGVVTVNSTAGLEAMQAGLPVKTLVPAHFDIAGLTAGCSLDDFWTVVPKPDPELLAEFIQAIAASIQVRGSIHNKDGLKAAARNMADRILARTVNEPGAFEAEPPRLPRARALGINL